MRARTASVSTEEALIYLYWLDHEARIQHAGVVIADGDDAREIDVDVEYGDIEDADLHSELHRDWLLLRCITTAWSAEEVDWDTVAILDVEWRPQLKSCDAAYAVTVEAVAS